jgi:hypothetical protein
MTWDSGQPSPSTVCDLSQHSAERRTSTTNATTLRAGIEAAVLTWLKAGNRKHKDWDNTTLGILRLDGSRLVIEVNSARRRERIAREISKRFGSTATLVETTTTDIVKELQERRARGDTAEPMTSSTEPERTPEIQSLEAELMQRHWDAWIETKVPALGNRTPRQAAKTAKGRGIGGAPQRLRTLSGTAITRVPAGSRRLAAAVGTRLRSQLDFDQAVIWSRRPWKILAIRTSPS